MAQYYPWSDGNVLYAAALDAAFSNISAIGVSITATGTNQSTALTLTNYISVVTTVSSNTGVLIAVGGTNGNRQIVLNRGANALNVYPGSGGQFEALGTNAAYVLQPGQDAMFTFGASSLQGYITNFINTSSLATSNPGTSGILWNNGGVLTISQ